VVDYVDTTRNWLRSVETNEGFITPSMSLKRKKVGPDIFKMLPFGVKVVVQYAKGQRPGHKTLTQVRGWVGAFVGYGEAHGFGGAYKIYNPADKKVHVVSYNFCVVDEGSFPWKSDKGFMDEKIKAPLDFMLTPQAILDPVELAKYGLDEGELKEAVGASLTLQAGRDWEAEIEESMRGVRILPGSSTMGVGSVGPIRSRPVVESGRGPAVGGIISPPSRPPQGGQVILSPPQSPQSPQSPPLLPRTPPDGLGIPITPRTPVLSMHEMPEESKEGSIPSEPMTPGGNSMPLLEEMTPKGVSEFGSSSIAMDAEGGDVGDRSTRTGYRLRDRAPINYAVSAPRERQVGASGGVVRSTSERHWIIDVTESKMEEGNKLYKVIWQLGDDDEKSEKREEWIDRDPLWKQGGSIRQMMRNVDERGGDPKAPSNMEDLNPMALFTDIRCPPSSFRIAMAATVSAIKGAGKVPGSPIPQNRRQAMKNPFWDGYSAAEGVEMDLHRSNGTWRYVPLTSVPADKIILDTKWVYDDKIEIDEKGEQYLRRWVISRERGLTIKMFLLQ
jgi:hypothetical protein